MNSLSQRLDSFAEAWRPEPGDKLIGTVVDLDERESAYSDEPYPIVTVQTEEGGEFAFHAFHTVARNEVAKQRPRVGDRIGIAYHGKPDGRSYELYRVIVEREDGGAVIDWEKHTAEATGTRGQSEEEHLEYLDTLIDTESAEGQDDDSPF